MKKMLHKGLRMLSIDVYFPGFEDLTITHPMVQQNNVGGNDTHISHARFDGITFTCPPSGQNRCPFRSVTKVNWSPWSPSCRQCKKRIRFRFAQWTNEEKQIMDRELKESMKNWIIFGIR